MTRSVRLALALAAPLAFAGLAHGAAKPSKAPKKVAWTPPIANELLPLQIDRIGHVLVCTRNKECSITGRFGANTRMLFALDGDDGTRRFALLGSKGWDAQKITIKVPASVPGNTMHRLTIVDEKGRAVSNSIRLLVSLPSGCQLDEDGDSHEAIACGGDDCDDADGNRYPGNIEVCDTKNHDEDCDVRTFGYRDSDLDGHPDGRCCNGTSELHCGDDCDDAQSSVHRGQPDTCNRVDDNCDGWIDELVQVKVYRDADADLYGNRSDSKLVCIQDVPSGWVLDDRDCKDGDAGVHPGRGCS
jgi:hypothetical protein